MSNVIELNPVDFVTIGTIGPKGKRTFHLQAGKDNRIVSFTIEKEQAQALSSAIAELLDDIDAHDDIKTEADFSNLDMELREPIEPLFRIAQMGLAYEANENKVILVAQEFLPQAEDDIDDDEIDDLADADDLDEADAQEAYNLFESSEGEPQVVRMWCTREQMRALSLHAMDTVKSGRPDAKQNGRIIFYWT
ncbi:MAG: DUF3090 family protein [Chloroflexi bacterium]|nr:DUF3090 family protein [Chloroflexota bacterium]